MNTLKNSLFVITLIAFSGCATRAKLVLNQSVGPGRYHANRRRGVAPGELEVFSALEVINAVDSDHPTHTNYTIDDQGGKTLRRVDNRTGSFYQDPVVVSLPAGAYKVEARATNTGEVIVPVVIEAGKCTVIYLDGSNPPQSKAQPGDQWVRLPGGQIIGEKAN